MLTAIIVAGLGLLLAGGVLQLRQARPVGDPERHVFGGEVTPLTREDVRDPAAILDADEKARNAGVVAVEVLATLVGAVVVVSLLGMASVALAVKLVSVATFAVGATLVGMGLSARVDLGAPAPEEDPTATPDADAGAVLADVLGEAVAQDYRDVRRSMATARGDGADEAAAGVLAAARDGRSLSELREWADASGVADPEDCESRARALAEADVVRIEEDRLRVEMHLKNADTDQLAAVAASVL
jgi:hypothetical protein